MGEATLLPDLGTEILIPICAVVGIAFALAQWLLVSKVKLSTSSDADSKNGVTDRLVEEEDGFVDHAVVRKCADIQAAISEGIYRSVYYILIPCRLGYSEQMNWLWTWILQLRERERVAAIVLLVLLVFQFMTNWIALSEITWRYFSYSAESELNSFRVTKFYLENCSEWNYEFPLVLFINYLQQSRKCEIQSTRFYDI